MGPPSTEALRRRARELEASVCRDSFADFVRRAWHVLEPNGTPFAPNPGTEAIALHLQAVADGQIRLLGIACPPGFGKTTLCSVAFPAWMWSRDPSWRALCASHAYKLAADIARKFLRLVTSDWYRALFPHVQIESDAADKISTTRSGVRYAVGVEGAMTGFRADCGVIDDSLNAIDAESKLEVAKVNAWYDSALSTRFDQGKQPAIVVIQQRLAENDLIAHVRDLGGEILELPARFDAGRRCVTSIWQDPRERDGEVLAPQIHPEAFLDEQLRVLRPHGFAAQYQQRPAPREGNQFKIGMWSYSSLGVTEPSPRRHAAARKDPPYVIPRRRDGALDLDWLCITVDATGGSIADDASALGLLVVGGKGQRRFVLDDRTPGPRTFLQTIADIKSAIRAAVATAGRQPKLVVLVEKKALGQGGIEVLTKALHDGELVDGEGRAITAAVVPFEPGGRGTKEQRAAAMEPDVDAGLWHLMDGAGWVDAFLEEFATFPRGARDDRVDALSQVAIHFAAGAAGAWVDRFKMLTKL